MTSTATLPAATVAAAANAYAKRQRIKFEEPDGPRSMNYAAMYDAEALAKLAEAAALTGGTVTVSRDDFGLIEADYPAAIAVTSTT